MVQPVQYQTSGLPVLKQVEILMMITVGHSDHRQTGAMREAIEVVVVVVVVVVAGGAPANYSRTGRELPGTTQGTTRDCQMATIELPGATKELPQRLPETSLPGIWLRTTRELFANPWPTAAKYPRTARRTVRELPGIIQEPPGTTEEVPVNCP